MAGATGGGWWLLGGLAVAGGAWYLVNRSSTASAGTLPSSPSAQPQSPTTTPSYPSGDNSTGLDLSAYGDPFASSDSSDPFGSSFDDSSSSDSSDDSFDSTDDTGDSTDPENTYDADYGGSKVIEGEYVTAPYQYPDE